MFVAILCSALVLFPARRADAFVVAPLIPPAIAAGTSTTLATGATVTGAAAAGGGAALCVGTVVCAAVVLTGIALVGIGTYAYITWNNEPEQPNADVEFLPAGNGQRLGYSINYASCQLGNFGYVCTHSILRPTDNLQPLGIIGWLYYPGESVPSAWTTQVTPSWTETVTFALGTNRMDAPSRITFIVYPRDLCHYLEGEARFECIKENALVSLGDPGFRTIISDYAPDPLRIGVVTGDCLATNGAVTTVTTQSSTYTATQTPAPLPVPACPPGSGLVGYTVEEHVENTSGNFVPTGTTLIDTRFTPETITTYRECLGTGNVCTPETQAEDTPTPVCAFGPYTSSGACVEPLSDPAPNPTPSPSTSPTSTTSPAPNPSPTATTSPAPTPTASPTPWPTPTPQPTPSIGPSIIPGPVEPNPLDPSVPNPTSTDPASCAPSGWEILNPFAYVTGSACVLQWAFVPRELSTAANTIGAAFNASALGTIVGIVNDFTQPLIMLGGIDATDENCLGPRVAFPFGDEELIGYPFSACEEPAKTASQAVLTIGTITVTIGGLWLTVSIVLNAFGIRNKIFDGDDD